MIQIDKSNPDYINQIIKENSLAIAQPVNYPDSKTLHISKAAQNSIDGNTDSVLAAPANSATTDQNILFRKLDGTSQVADTFNIMKIIHQMMIQMRRQAAEAKQDAYHSQWVALDAKADEMRQAAKKELAASIVSSGLSFAGSATSLNYSSKSMRISTELNGFTKPNINQNQTISAQKNIGLDEIVSTKPKPESSGKQNQTKENISAEKSKELIEDTKKTNSEVNDAKQKPTEDQQKPEKTEKTETNQNPNSEIQADRKMETLRARADSYNARAQAITQLSSAFGQIIGAGLNYAAATDRVQVVEQETNATQAQATVENENDFVRSASEGERAIRDALQQMINSEAQVNIKIMA